MSKIVFLGDSITKGTDYGEVSKAETFSYLVSSASGWSSYINAGVSSDTSSKVLNRLNRDVISEQPDTCVIMIGANDWATSVSVLEYKTNLHSIILALKNANISVVVLTSVLERGSTQNIAKAQNYILALEHVCSELDVPVIDIYRECATAYLYLQYNDFVNLYADNIHLTKTGHRFVADVILRPQFSKFINARIN